MKISPKLLKELLLVNARLIAAMVVLYSVCLFIEAWLFHHPFDERRLQAFSLITAPIFSIFCTVKHYREKDGKKEQSKIADKTKFWQ